MTHDLKLFFIIIGPQIPRGERFTWKNQPFAILACPPTIDKPKVIKVCYEVRVKVYVPWGLFDLTLKLSITMGTVPYQAAYGQQQPPLTNQVVSRKCLLFHVFDI